MSLGAVRWLRLVTQRDKVTAAATSSRMGEHFGS